MPRKSDLIVLAAQQVLKKTRSEYGVPPQALHGRQAMKVLMALIRQGILSPDSGVDRRMSDAPAKPESSGR